jgi:hypothetical protein
LVSKFDLITEKLRPLILEYLKIKGLYKGGPIRCLSPDHEDKHPSMLCDRAAEHNWRVKCSSCGFSADIFDVYAILNNTPKSGIGWFQETVKPLANDLGILIDEIEFSEKDKFAYESFKVYEQVLSLISHEQVKGSFADKYISEHCWTAETLEELDIGWLDYDVLLSKIEENVLERF